MTGENFHHFSKPLTVLLHRTNGRHCLLLGLCTETVKESNSHESATVRQWSRICRLWDYITIRKANSGGSGNSKHSYKPLSKYQKHPEMLPKEIMHEWLFSFPVLKYFHTKQSFRNGWKFFLSQKLLPKQNLYIHIHLIWSGLILGLRPANEARRYKVMPSLIGQAQT